jgi:O-antigen ligase
MDDLTVGLLAANIVLAGIGLAFLCIKRYEVAVFLMASSPLITTIFLSTAPESEAEQDAGVGSYVRISLLLLIGGVGLIQFFKLRSKERGKVPFYFILMGIFLVFALISTTYSIDPRYTFIRSVSFLAVFGFMLGLYGWLEDRQRLDQLFVTLFLVTAFCILLNIIAAIAWPEIVWFRDENRFRGLLNHPNSVGSFCMVSYLILLWKYERCNFFKKGIILILIMALGSMHLLSGSRGSLIPSILGISLWFIFLKKKVKLLIFFGIVVIGMVGVLSFKPSSFERKDSDSKTDLTGRPEFWQGSLILIKEKPILGYGYGVEGKVWDDPRFNNPDYSLWKGTARSSLHNGYLSIAVGGGIMSLFIWCVILWLPLWQSMTLSYHDYKAFIISIMSMTLLVNFVETEIPGGYSIASIFFWISWAAAGKLKQMEDSERYFLREARFTEAT